MSGLKGRCNVVLPKVVAAEEAEEEEPVACKHQTLYLHSHLQSVCLCVCVCVLVLDKTRKPF